MVQQFLNFCETVHPYEEFISQINETGDESLSNITIQLSRSQPSAFKGDRAKDLEKLFSVKTSSNEENIYIEATQIVKEMFPDFGNGFSKYHITYCICLSIYFS